MSIRNLHVLIIVCVGYVVAQMLADISNLRELTIAGMSVSAFSLVYPLTFTLRDLAHRLAGARVARTLIITSAVIYLLAQAYFWLIANLPPAMTQDEQVVLGELLTAEWRFLLAAVAATVIAQLVDTELYEFWKKRFGSEKLWGRVLFSNAISIPLDRFLFLVLAFAGATTTDAMVDLFITATIVRLVIGLISIPGIYLVEEHSEDWVKLAEIR